MRPAVSCIIPAYNESPTIGDVVRAATSCDAVDEVIVVSDGSTDATAACATGAGASRVLTLPENGGKGAAVWVALQESAGDIVLLLDGDLMGLRREHVAQLLQPLLAGEAEMAVAELREDPLHDVLGGLSGQRAFERSLVDGAQTLARTGYGLELALDRLARRRGARVRRVILNGVTHRGKRQKYGTVHGLRKQVRASMDLGRQVGRGALVAAAVLVVAAVPLLVVHPTRASDISLPRLAGPGHSDRVLVVVAHPDDEVIGAGGLIAMAGRTGAHVSVLILTNGDANRITAALVGHHLRPRAADFQASGRVRQAEAIVALRRLGLDGAGVFFAGFPDRGLDRVLEARAAERSPFTGLASAGYPRALEPGAPYTREALIGAIRSVIAAVRPTIIVTHAPFDAHADHRATYAAVREAAGEVPLYTFLVHARGFPRPIRYARNLVLLPPPLRLPDGWTWVTLDLPRGVLLAKQQALAAYRSQRSSPYLRVLLPAFLRSNELFALPPSSDRP